MFETAEIGSRIDKDTYRADVPDVRSALLEVQRELAQSPVSAVVIVGGSEGAGKESTVSLLLAWLDARGVETHAMWDETDEERGRPRFWRFWRVLPPRGKMAILFGSWYTQPIIDRAFDRIDDAQFEREMRHIRDFERMLSSEGVAIIKFWMHLSKKDQERRLQEIKADTRMRWRVGKRAFRYMKKYDAFRSTAEECVRLTGTGFAPWHIVEAVDKRYRNLTVATTVLTSLRQRLDEVRSSSDAETHPVQPLPKPAPENILRRLDLGRTMSESEYDKKLGRYQGRLAKLSRKLHDAGRSLVLVFEGPDASGKGGAIRRLTEAMDPRLWRVVSVAAPTDEELARPYLWRFWRSLPLSGHVTINDRSWYGRVLVERIEGFCHPDDWRRAYTEINEFERELDEFGTIVMKFWLATSPEEQLRRFQDREAKSYKQYKLTEEDWRNRDKWDAYEAAACDMIERTSTDRAPWVLVEANDKYWARIKVIKAVYRRLAHELQ